jgi:hypothetical protein
MANDIPDAEVEIRTFRTPDGGKALFCHKFTAA